MNRYDSNKAIEKYRNLYSSYSRAKLIAEMAQHKISSDPHIAAKQLLDENSTRFSKWTNRWAFLAFIVGLLSILVVVGPCAYNYFRSQLDITEKTKPKMSKSKLLLSSKDIEPPSKTDNQKTKSPSRTERKSYEQ